MSLSAKQQFLRTRYGYKDRDFADYAQDHRCSLSVAIDRLFYHHVNMQQNQGKLFEAKTQEEARAICKQYNDTHDPGFLSRKAEYEEQ